MSTRTESTPVPSTPPAPSLPLSSRTSPPPTEQDQFMRELLGAMVEFRDGNFDVRMPRDLVGVAGKLADVFNDVVSVSGRRANEVARVCRVVGKEGRLKERMHVPGAEGARL